MWLARIFPNLWLLGDNAEKPQNKRRRKGKNTGIPNPGVEVVASKLLPNYIEFMPGYLGAFTHKNTGSDFHPRLPFPSLPIHLRHKHIYSFKQHLFMFQESDTGRPLHSAVPGRSGCKIRHLALNKHIPQPHLQS